jgi:hypothetical protein
LASRWFTAFLTQPMIERHFGLFVPITAPTATAYVYLCTVIVAGVLIGFVPAVKGTGKRLRMA